jgi:dienelactone hydrolase
MGVVKFVGDHGSPRPDEVCSPDRLVDAVKQYGATTRVPTLWIYAENDHFFGPALARRMFDAFVAAGAPRAEFFPAPTTGKDGHQFINEASTTWEPVVSDFLHKIAAPR